MTVMIRFNLDTKEKDEKSTITIQSPFSDLGQTRDNLNERLDETATSPKAMMPIRDADTGSYIFVHTMKIASIDVYEVDE